MESLDEAERYNNGCLSRDCVQSDDVAEMQRRFLIERELTILALMAIGEIEDEQE